MTTPISNYTITSASDLKLTLHSLEYIFIYDLAMLNCM